MSKVKTNPANHAELVAAVADYQKAGKTLAAAMEAARAADVAAADGQAVLNVTREEVARLMKKAGLKQARCGGLLLSVDAEGLAACADRFVAIG